MTKTAIRVQVETPTLDLDARLALAQLAMDAKLNEAAVRFEVNTAHIESALVVDFAPAILPAPGLTPLADLLHRAHARIQRDGWTTGHCRDEQGATCLYGAIRTEAATPAKQLTRAPCCSTPSEPSSPTPSPSLPGTTNSTTPQ
ncbi:hypothetical protein J4032_22060 [Streptomyces formicae]|uniref:Uncharacterized protein n=1 Tax=Streptomyces formicae TaxID=1616117 RepID=A0ABY3WMA9_9ACTN|nr:hypothetical protein [Streptomyces formicae]UNM13783.1 hypothetical protein J4032_22060 [Streptomyces formicae]